MSERSRRKAVPAQVAALIGGQSRFPFRRKRNKFHVAPQSERTLSGVLFASKWEMKRHLQLTAKLELGKIHQLARQVPLVLVRSQDGKPLLTWIADWTYIEDGQPIIEDFTGVMTPLKRSNMRICADVYPYFNIRISTTEGSNKDRHIVVTDCVKGRVPVKRRIKVKGKLVA